MSEGSHLLKYFESKKDEFAKLVAELADFKTYSKDSATINRFLDRLIEIFSEFDPKIERIPTPRGDLLFLDFFDNYPNFVGVPIHSDVVRSTEEEVPIVRRGSKLSGTGVYDMKSALGVAYFVLKAAKEGIIEIPRAIKLAVTPDEEIGSEVTTEPLIERFQSADFALVQEPSGPNGELKIERKGVATVFAYVRGKPAHSGIEPEKGVDANRALYEILNRIYLILEKYPQVSFNPGIIAGGVQRNIVPPDAFLDAELRSFSPESLASVREEIKEIKLSSPAEIDIKADISHPPLCFTKKNMILRDEAVIIALGLGVELGEIKTGGGSDGSVLSAAGIPTLDGLGIRGGGAHTPDEFIDVDDFPFRATLISQLCALKTTIGLEK